VLLYESIHPEGLAVLEEKAQVRYAPGWSEEEVLPIIGDIEGIIIRANGRVSRRLMERAPRLKVVGRHGVGLDNVDVAAASELGVYVVNTPAANAEAVAEHALGLIVALSKQIVQGDRELRAGNWDARYSLIGRELHRRTLGVVGCGRIGCLVAQMAHAAFKVEVLYYDVVARPELEAESNAQRVGLKELLRRADYVTLHVPLIPNTRGLLGERELALMKPTALLVNTSRGQVVDESALTEALTSKRIAGAGLDVFWTEPLPADSPLLSLQNVLLTPHMAAHTEEALRNMSLVSKDIVAVLEGQEPEHCVNRDVMRRRTQSRGDSGSFDGDPN
jgi:D-3-phosphoglycerate dehydrogenase